jgi:hypothetical protein
VAEALIRALLEVALIGSGIVVLVILWRRLTRH